MEPVSPVFDDLEEHEHMYGKNQPEYSPLPALLGASPEYRLTIRFRPSDEERQSILEGADIMVCMLTFGKIVLPILLYTATEGNARQSAEVLQLVGLSRLVVEGPREPA